MSKTDDSATVRAHVEAWDCTCKIKASCVRCGTLILMDANARQREEIARLRAASRAFVEQWTKLLGFPLATDPYSGAIVAARAALAEGGAA